MKPKTPTLEELRRKLTKFQKELLEHTWEHFRPKGEWPILRKMYSKHGKQKVRQALSGLTGNVGWEEDSSNRWKQYRLSLLGALLTSRGKDFQSLLLRYFDYQRTLFQKEPDLTFVRADDVKHKLTLNKDEVELLGLLLSLGSLGGSSSPSETWGINAMEEAADFPETGSLAVEVNERVFRHYRHNEPIFQDERQARHFVSVFSPSLEGVPLSTAESHPSEIAVSLERLRNNYKDTKKLGFLIMRFTGGKPFRKIVNAIKQTARKHNLIVLRADDDQFHADLWGNVRTLLHGCSFGIAVYERIDTNEPNANVGLEVGYLMAMGKPVLLLKDKSVPALQADLAGKLYTPFDPHDPEKTIPEQMTKWLKANGIVV